MMQALSGHNIFFLFALKELSCPRFSLGHYFRDSNGESFVSW